MGLLCHGLRLLQCLHHLRYLTGHYMDLRIRDFPSGYEDDVRGDIHCFHMAWLPYCGHGYPSQDYGLGLWHLFHVRWVCCCHGYLGILLHPRDKRLMATFLELHWNHINI